MDWKDSFSKKGISRRDFMKATGIGLGSAMMFPNFALAAKDWPDMPITIVVGFSAGGGTDTVSRAQAAVMEKVSGATINCINKTGSNGALATKFVWNKPADGNWWVANTAFGRTLRCMGYIETCGYKDWQHFASSGSIAGWAVRPESPYKDMADFIEDAKKNPGKIRVSMDNIGGTWHMANIFLSTVSGITLNNIPYKGGAPAVLSLLQKESDVVASGLHEQVEFLKAGKLRNLAVFTKKPVTVAGAGTLRPVTDFVPGLGKYAPWGAPYTMAIRRDVPVDRLNKIKDMWIKATNDPGFDGVLKKKNIFRNILVGADADKEFARLESIINWTLWDLKVPHIKIEPSKLDIPRPEEFEEWWPPKGYSPRI